MYSKCFNVTIVLSLWSYPLNWFKCIRICMEFEIKIIERINYEIPLLYWIKDYGFVIWKMFSQYYSIWAWFEIIERVFLDINVFLYLRERITYELRTLTRQPCTVLLKYLTKMSSLHMFTWGLRKSFFELNYRNGGPKTYFLKIEIYDGLIMAQRCDLQVNGMTIPYVFIPQQIMFSEHVFRVCFQRLYVLI